MIEFTPEERAMITKMMNRYIFPDMVSYDADGTARLDLRDPWEKREAAAEQEMAPDGESFVISHESGKE